MDGSLYISLMFQMAAKQLCQADVEKVYKMANKEDFKWEYILDTSSYNYLETFRKAYNFPMNFIMGTLIPAVASLCGSKASVQTGNFSNPLNTFAFIIGEPGCGKSRCQNKIWQPMCAHIKKKHGVSMGMENFTCAGFQRHQKDNAGYGLINSGEGQRFLTNIHCKMSKHEGEESRLNQVWDGVGDETLLKDGTRGYESTAVSMVLYIQPQPLISEMVYLLSSNGFFYRILFFLFWP